MIQFFLPSRLRIRPAVGLPRTLYSTMLPGAMSPTVGMSEACVAVSLPVSCRVLHGACQSEPATVTAMLTDQRAAKGGGGERGFRTLVRLLLHDRGYF